MGRGTVRQRFPLTGSAAPPPPPPDPEPSDYDSVILAAGPVAYLTLDGTAGGLLDLTGNGHHATATGGPAAAAGPGDGRGSVRFNSSGTQYLTVADHNRLSVPTTGILTLEAWVSPGALDHSHTEGTGPYVQILGKNRYDDRSEYELRMYNQTTVNDRSQRISGYSFNPEGGLGTGSYFQDPISVDEWVHVTVVINMIATSATYPTGYTKIFKNGTLRDTDALQNFNVVPGNTSAPLNIGAASLDSFFEGRVARFAVYNYELSASAIRSHYRLLVPATPGSITLHRHIGSASSTSSGTTLSVTVGAPGVPAGSTLLVKAAAAHTASGPTMSDSRGNTYTRDRTTPSSGNVTRAAIFSCPVATPLVQGDVIQIVWPSAVTPRLVSVDEFEDVALTSALLDQDSQSATSTGPVTGTAPAVDTTTADAMVYGMMAVSGPSTDTYTEDTDADFASLTTVGTNTGSGDITLRSGWKSVNATGAYKYLPALGTSRLWLQLIAAYKAGPIQPPPSTYDAEVLARGPVAYLTLDGAAGDGLADQTGHGHNATATGSPTGGTGIGDGKGSVVFDSTGTQHLEIADHNALSVTATGILAVECWISPSVLNFAHEQGSGAPYVYFAGKAGSNANEWQCRMYSQDTPGVAPPRPQRVSIYVFNLSGGQGAGSYFQVPVAVNEWVHYVGIINTVATSSQYPQGYTRVYRNGVLMDTDSIEPWGITPANGTAPVRIGTSALASHFEGRVAKFAIWNREPTATEIQTRYSMAAPPVPPAPAGTAEFQVHIGSATATASGTTSAVTLAQGVPIGHTLIVHAVGDYTANAPTVTDTRGNFYTADRSAPDGGNTIRGTTYSAPITEALQAGDTITVTWPSSVTKRAVTVHAWTKVAYPTVVDVSNGGTTSGTTPSVDATTTYGDVLLVAAIFTAGPTGDTYDEDTAHQWTSLTRAGTTGGTATDNRTVNAAYRAVPTTGTYSYTPELGTSRTYITQVVAYRAGAFVPPTPVTGSAELVRHLDDDHSASTGTTLVLTLPAGGDGGQPATRADVPAGLKISTGSLVAPTLPITGMTGSDTVRNIVAPGVYEGYDFPGAVNILSDGVTLRNCRWLNSADFWAVESDRKVGTIIEDCLIDGAPKGIGGVNYTARRVAFVNMKDDPFQVWSASGTGAPTIIEDCVAYDFRPALNKHVDGIQQVVSGLDNLYIRRCWLELRDASGYTNPGGDTGYTSPIFCQPTPEAGSTVGITLVEDCVLDSNDFYAIRFEDGSTNRPIALRNRLRSNVGAALIDGGVIFEGEGNTTWDGTPYHHPSEIPPGSGIPSDGGEGGTPVPVGHTVIVKVVADYTAGAPTVTDERGNTYTRDRTGVDSGSTIRIAVLSAPVATALQAGDEITITWPTSVQRRAAIADEYSDVLVPTATDGANGRQGTSTAPSVSVTTVNADDLLIAAVGLAGPSTDVYTEDPLWTGLTSRGTSAASPATLDRTIHAAWRSVASAGAYTYAPTLGTSRLWVAAFVAYKAGLPAPPPPPEEPVVLSAVSGLVPAGTLSTSGLSSTTLTEDTSTTTPNPERGFFQYSETHYQSDNSGHVPLVAADLTTARTTLGRTLVFRYFGLEKYRTSDTIDSTYLNLLAADLAAARTAGVKLIPRFAYRISSCPGEPGPYASDATPARVVAHIGQLAPVLNAYADVIYAIQAGFIGCWGEWYYTDNFADDGSQPWILTTQNWTDRQNVVNALLNGLDDRIFVLLRYSGLKDHWYPHPSTHVDTRRLGWHNDAFLAAFDDFGTYTSFSDMSASDTRAYTSFEALGRPVPNGGESAATNGTDSEWTAALAELIARGFVFLNPLYHPDVLNSWGSNIDIAKRRLGHRLVGEVARAQASVARGGTLNVQIDITNDGFAYPISQRPVYVVLDDQAGNRLEYRTSVDVRTFTPNGVTQTLYAHLAIPSSGLPAGAYRVCLWIPDQDESLQDRPEYSIRLTNTGTWDSVRGYNNLRGVTIT